MIRKVISATRTELRRRLGQSAFDRWGDKANLLADWDDRTALVAAMIEQGSVVLEFGAGRMVLKTHLPDNCTYIPSDLVDRGPGTIVCDLNARPLPDFPDHDVSVFIGTLEYVNDPATVLAHLNSLAVVGSYTVRADGEGVLRRRNQGWVNDYTWSELNELFEAQGYRLTEDGRYSLRGRAEDQRTFRFIR